MQHNIKIGIDYMDDDEFYYKYYGIKLDQCDRYLIEPELTNKDLEIYITSFDGLLYAKYQIQILKHFLSDVDFNLVIVDTNSHINPEISLKTKELCIQQNISYLKLPHNKMQDLQQFSSKLGIDMNWLWRNCIKIRQPKYFGFIEQDCFLINHIWGYLKDYLDQKGMYGYAWPAEKDVNIDKKYWLVHILNNFFSYKFIKDIPLDFRPAGFIGLDTGGCNYFSLFQHYKREDYLQTETPLSKFINKEWEEVFREPTMQDNEKWLHMLNSTKAFTNHPKEKEFKEVYMTGLLNGILLNQKIK